MMEAVGFTVVLLASTYALLVSIVTFLAMMGYGGKRFDKLIAVLLFAASILGFYLALSNSPFPIFQSFGG